MKWNEMWLEINSIAKRNTPWFIKNFRFKNLIKNERLYIFSNGLFYLKVQSLRLMMEHDFIQMTVSVGPKILHGQSPIFQCIFGGKWQYFNNGIADIVLKRVNRCWFFKGTLLLSWHFIINAQTVPNRGSEALRCWNWNFFFDRKFDSRR